MRKDAFGDAYRVLQTDIDESEPTTSKVTGELREIMRLSQIA